MASPSSFRDCNSETGSTSAWPPVLTQSKPFHRIKTAGREVLFEASAYASCPLVQRLGHLPLEQVIGVRIPGGQPDFLTSLPERHSASFSSADSVADYSPPRI